MSGFCDLHAHFVYGLDDGAQTREDMERMLDAAYADGVTELFATPHTTPGVEPFAREQYLQRLEEARRYCRQKGYGLTLYCGAEILYTPWLEQYVSQHRLPALAESEFLLVEFVPDIAYAELDAALQLLEGAGYIPVLAHIERYACLRGRAAYRLKERHDIRYQINCSAVRGGRGFFVDRRVKRWLHDRLIDYVASDSHNCHTRRTRMREAYTLLERQCGKHYAAQLMKAEV